MEKLNTYDQEIMYYLEVNPKIAIHIQNNMIINFSECTQEDFIREAIKVHSLIKKRIL